MKNVEVKVEGNKMTIVVDLPKDYGMSGSGKSIIIASTEGNKDFDGIKLGLNVYKPTR